MNSEPERVRIEMEFSGGVWGSIPQGESPRGVGGREVCHPCRVGFERGFPDQEREENYGITIRPGDVDRFVAAVLRLKGNPGETEAMGRRAREALECK